MTRTRSSRPTTPAGRRAIFAALLIVALGSSFGAAQHAAALGPSYVYGIAPNISDPVEQQTGWPFPADESQWVINPYHSTPCAWDVDDLWQQHAQGTLNAGASLTVSECVVASPTMTYRTVNGVNAWWSSATGSIGTQLRAPISSLTVSVCWKPQGRCFTPRPLFDRASKTYLYSSCSHAQYAPDDPALYVVPGSQGGVGLVQTVTVTVTNSTSHNARNIFSDVSMVNTSEQASGCDGSALTDAYPFQFSVS